MGCVFWRGCALCIRGEPTPSAAGLKVLTASFLSHFNAILSGQLSHQAEAEGQKFGPDESVVAIWMWRLHPLISYSESSLDLLNSCSVAYVT